MPSVLCKKFKHSVLVFTFLAGCSALCTISYADTPPEAVETKPVTTPNTKPETKSDTKPDTKAPAKVKTKKELKKVSANPVVIIDTSMGPIEVELFEKEAPISVKNFLQYVDEGFYNGTIFHRVIDNFMIQGGGFTEDMKQKETHEQIKNEASSELKNLRGTLAMARTQVVDSATAQFFINVKDNAFLDHRDKTPSGYGYAVFAKVVSGMDTVDKIKATKTTTKGMYSDVPATAVIIKTIKRKVG